MIGGGIADEAVKRDAPAERVQVVGEAPGVALLKRSPPRCWKSLAWRVLPGGL